MHRKKIYLIILLMLPAGAAGADEKCVQRPDAVQAYLRDHKGSSLVTVDDLLDPESREAWRKSGKEGLCPGFAASDLDGSGRIWYGLGLLYKKAGKTFEKLVLLSPDAGGLKEQTLSDLPLTGEASVVWRNTPGEYFDYNVNHNIQMPHDTIMYERIDKTATAYYLDKGKLRSVLTSD
jgi:hypothetical protein